MGKRGVVRLALCKGRVFNGIIVNESGLYKFVFAERVEQRNEYVTSLR